MDGAKISAATLRERLPATVAAAVEREKTVYKEECDESSPVPMSYVNFVKKAEELEKAGHTIVIVNSH